MVAVKNPKCDECEKDAAYVCCCCRCSREPDDEDKFFSCEEHKQRVASAHMRIRGRPLELKKFYPKS